MRSRYRSLCLITLALLLTGHGVASQTFVRKGFNDPATLVDAQMKAMPHSLGLTSRQRKLMRQFYLELSTKEQKIAFEPGPSMLKRGKVRVLAEQCEARIQALLSPKQYKGLKAWEKSTHRPVRHF